MEALGQQSFQCPQCGAPAQFRQTTVSTVCEYCESTVVRDNFNLELIGKISTLVDSGSPILLHARGKGRGGVPFEVIGRLQVGYGRGYWNEWYLEYADGEPGWLAEFLGQFAILSSITPLPPNLPAYPEAKPTAMVSVLNQSFRVSDRREAQYQGSEGSLPFDVRPGAKFFAVDLRGSGGEYLSFDYGAMPQSPPAQVYRGQMRTLDELQLRPRRQFEGWRDERN